MNDKYVVKLKCLCCVMIQLYWLGYESEFMCTISHSLFNIIKYVNYILHSESYGSQ